MSAALEARGLTKRYGRREALCGLDLRVGPGELVALVGENGAGKTTTLAMISGQLVPDVGQALIRGHDVFAAPRAARSELGYVAQDLLLPPYLTVAEMVAFACDVKQRPVHPARLLELLELAGLADDADRLIGELSHGMQRKAAWVVALATEPSVLVLDEGLAGLDAASSAALVQQVVARLAGGAAALWAEHDLELIAPHLSRVLVLHGGRLAEEVSGDAVREDLAAGRLNQTQQRWTGTV